MKLFSLVFILSLAVTGAARADIIPPCPAPADVTVLPFDQVPIGLQKALHDKAGDLSPPPNPASPAPAGRRKLPAATYGLFVWNRSTRWVIATQHGSRGYDAPVYVFDLAADGKRVGLTTEKRASGKTVCAVAKALVAAQ